MSVDPDLVRLLKRLKLGPLLPTLPERLTLARSQQLDYVAFLTLLLADEVQRRDQQALERHLIQAGFEGRVTLDGFDWTRRSNSTSVNSSTCSTSSSWPARNIAFSSGRSASAKRCSPSAWLRLLCAPATPRYLFELTHSWPSESSACRPHHAHSV